MSKDTKKIIKKTENDKIFAHCTKCGCQLAYKIEQPKGKSSYIMSSEFEPGFSMCHSCLVEHCVNTDCDKCDIKKKEKCRFVSMKEFYLEEMEREKQEKESATTLYIFQSLDDSERILKEEKLVIELSNHYIPLYNRDGKTQYNKNEIDVICRRDGFVQYLSFGNNEKIFLEKLFTYRQVEIEKLEKELEQRKEILETLKQKVFS